VTKMILEPLVDSTGKLRQGFVMLVKFAAQKGPQNVADFFDYVDTKLQQKYGKNRHEMDIHERNTYVTLGQYDMVIVWDAPDMDTASKFFGTWVNPGIDFGSSENLVAVARGRY